MAVSNTFRWSPVSGWNPPLWSVAKEIMAEMSAKHPGKSIVLHNAEVGVVCGSVPHKDK